MWKYIQWRVETYTGIEAKDCTVKTVFLVLFKYRDKVLPYVRWAVKMKYLY